MSVVTPCREALQGEVPTTAARLAKNATAAGWTVRTTYAEAVIDDKRIESVLVRVRRWPLAAVGAWHNGKFALGYVWSIFSSPRKVGARDLAVFVKEA